MLCFLAVSLFANYELEQVLILGSGPAGLTAAIYTTRAKLSTLVLEGDNPGGQIIRASLVENFPGFPEGISGVELQEKMRQQAIRFGARINGGSAVGFDFSQRPFLISLDNGRTIWCETVIIATGTSPKPLGLASEEFFRGKGVGGCAFCDAFLYQGKEIVVVGNGEMALDEAIFLASHASKVTIISESHIFDASKAIQEKVFENQKISILLNTAIEEILDVKQDRVTGVILKNTYSGESSFYPCEGIFIAIGNKPNTKIFEGHIDLDGEGYIVTSGEGGSKTNISGVFAAGSVISSSYTQVIRSAASGSAAAIEAYHFLQHLHER